MFLISFQSNTKLLAAALAVMCYTLPTNGMANVQVIKDQYGNTITTSQYSSYYNSYPHSYYARSYAPRTYYNDPVVYYRSSDASYICDNCNTQVYKDAPTTGTVIMHSFILYKLLQTLLHLLNLHNHSLASRLK